jgi:hypothetical protein
MKKEKSILLTFDFELFLGERSGSVQKCMIEPTKELLKCIDKHKMSTIFFVDTLYLYRLNEISKSNVKAKNDFETIITLLHEVIDLGGYVFHHLHPNWLDAIYLEEYNEWDVSNKDRFALSNLTKDEVATVFQYSEEIISLIYSGRNKPEVSGFRAGGLFAQPFTHYKEQMEQYNILLEMTVLKNSKGEGENGIRKFDFSTYPDEIIYNFSDDILVKDEKGKFIEIIMDQFKLKGIRKILNGIYYRKNVNKSSWKRWGDGKASGNVVQATTRSNKFLCEETYSIELLNKMKALFYVNEFKKENLLHLISHPKFFSQENVDALDVFLTKATRKYTIESDVFSIIKKSKAKL